MRKTGRNTKRALQSGQSMAEVALLAPLLLAMLMGAIEVGRYAYISILVSNAAHAGALYASQGPQPAGNLPGITMAADEDFQSNGQDTSALTVSSSAACACDSQGTLVSEPCDPATPPTCSSGHWIAMISVKASATFQPLFKYPGVPDKLSVSRTSTMRVALF